MKTLRQILEIYEPNTPDEGKFVSIHKSKVFPNIYSTPEYDALFKGNTKPIDRSAEQHGYDKEESKTVYRYHNLGTRKNNKWSEDNDEYMSNVVNDNYLGDLVNAMIEEGYDDQEIYEAIKYKYFGIEHGIPSSKLKNENVLYEAQLNSQTYKTPMKVYIEHKRTGEKKTLDVHVVHHIGHMDNPRAAGGLQLNTRDLPTTYQKDWDITKYHHRDYKEPN